MEQNTPGNLSVNLQETRCFEPPRDFAARAVVAQADYPELLTQAQADPESYWAQAAAELDWFEPWSQVLKWQVPHAEWFVGGKLNASVNCVDRHLPQSAAKNAIVWEGEPGEVVRWTYADLHRQVEGLTAVLRKRGLKSGDRVAIYMPLVPESVVAMLACARGGFVHTVVFGGFSAESLKDRIQDAGAKLVITADYGYRKGARLGLQSQVEQAVAACPGVQGVVKLRRELAGQLPKSGTPAAASAPETWSGRPAWDWHSELAAIAALPAPERQRLGQPERLDSEHPLFILYTSGTTGKPKGILHTTGGYLTGALRTTRTVFDLQPQDLYWCTADIGWITGHTYLVYGPLAAGASIFMYEGTPTHPGPDRIWDMVERHQISILYTAPTLIRALMRVGTDAPRSKNLQSLRLLGTVGEPINPEAWMWYRHEIGGDRCPIVDTYWQTETGAIVISPLPGVTATKPGSATRPLPGYDVEVVDKQGEPVPLGAGGYLVIRKPWPSMARTIHGNPERYAQAYWSDFKTQGYYFTGDGARKDEDGYIWCLGRVDDVLNVSGHRLGTMEIESALVSHPKVAEAAVVGRPDDLRGQAIVAFVTLKADAARAAADPASLEAIRKDLAAHVSREIGALARPDTADIRFADSLPKTRSGKIMRRLLRELATNGKVSGDTTTLEDLGVLAALGSKDEE